LESCLSLLSCINYIEGLGVPFFERFDNSAGALSGISYKRYYQQRCHDSNTNDMLVKEDGSLDLMRLQNSASIKCAKAAGYDWGYLTVERNCELAASFGVFTYRFLLFDFIFFFLFFYFFRFIGWLEKIFFFFCNAAGS
jgi:hypothetical protein